MRLHAIKYLNKEKSTYRWNDISVESLLSSRFTIFHTTATHYACWDLCYFIELVVFNSLVNHCLWVSWILNRYSILPVRRRARIIINHIKIINKISLIYIKYSLFWNYHSPELLGFSIEHRTKFVGHGIKNGVKLSTGEAKFSKFLCRCKETQKNNLK